MKFPALAAIYRDFRPGKIRQDEFRHIPWLLFWPAFGLRYILLERVLVSGQYQEVSCALDEYIPFQEVFLIPYVLWYVLIVGMHLYTFLCDIPAFKWYSKFMLAAFSISTLTFLLFPTCQNLRPTEFPRENFLTDIVQVLYTMDTNTNVCPSEHVIGSIAAFLASRRTESLRKPLPAAALAVTAFCTGIATVFLKQHSFVDVLAALPVCIIAYRICREKDAAA